MESVVTSETYIFATNHSHIRQAVDEREIVGERGRKRKAHA